MTQLIKYQYRIIKYECNDIKYISCNVGRMIGFTDKAYGNKVDLMGFIDGSKFCRIWHTNYKH